MYLVKNTVFNLLTSLVNRGSMLLVLLLSYYILDTAQYFQLTRFILYIELLSGVLNLISKHALLRRKYIFLNEIISLIVIQISFGLIATFFLGKIISLFGIVDTNHRIIYAALFLAIAINLNYILNQF